MPIFPDPWADPAKINFKLRFPGLESKPSTAPVQGDQLRFNNPTRQPLDVKHPAKHIRIETPNEVRAKNIEQLQKIGNFLRQVPGKAAVTVPGVLFGDIWNTPVGANENELVQQAKDAYLKEQQERKPRVLPSRSIEELRADRDAEYAKYPSIEQEKSPEDAPPNNPPLTPPSDQTPETPAGPPKPSYADLVKQVSDDRYNALAKQFDVEGVRNAQMQDFASQYVPAEGTPEFPDYQEALVDLRDQGLYNSETGVAPAIPTASPSEARNIFLNSAGSSLDGLKAMEAALGLRYAGGKYYLNVGGSPTEVSNAGARALKRGEIDAQALIDNPMYGALVQETPSTTPSRAQQPNFSQLKAYEPQSVQNMEPDVFNKPAEDFNRAHQTPAETNFEELRKQLQGMGSEFQPYFSDFSDPYLSPNDYPHYPYMR